VRAEIATALAEMNAEEKARHRAESEAAEEAEREAFARSLSPVDETFPEVEAAEWRDFERALVARRTADADAGRGDGPIEVGDPAPTWQDAGLPLSTPRLPGD
jgi:hypothetical protein